MASNRNQHKLQRVIFPEVLVEYFEISGRHNNLSESKFGLMKNTTCNILITRVVQSYHMILRKRK